MAKEAKIVCKFLKTVATKPGSLERLEVCKDVRKCSLKLLIKFKRNYLEKKSLKEEKNAGLVHELAPYIHFSYELAFCQKWVMKLP